MLEITNEILDLLEEAGYKCVANYVNMECCGELYTIDYQYAIDSEHGFRISVKENKIELTRLFFRKILITYAELKSPKQLIKLIKQCEKINK